MAADDLQPTPEGVAAPADRARLTHALLDQPPRIRLPPNVTSFLISRDHLAASLLPDAVPGRQGQVYHRPDKWR